MTVQKWPGGALLVLVVAGLGVLWWALSGATFG